MKVFVPNQTDADETRVAMVPAAAKKLAGPNVEALHCACCRAFVVADR